jgi:hypothetical protein
VLQGCYKGVTRVLPVRARACDRAEVLQKCYKGVIRVSQGDHKDVTRMLERRYKGVTRVLPVRPGGCDRVEVDSLTVSHEPVMMMLWYAMSLSCDEV